MKKFFKMIAKILAIIAIIILIVALIAGFMYGFSYIAIASWSIGEIAVAAAGVLVMAFVVSPRGAAEGTKRVATAVGSATRAVGKAVGSGVRGAAKGLFSGLGFMLSVIGIGALSIFLLSGKGKKREDTPNAANADDSTNSDASRDDAKALV